MMRRILYFTAILLGVFFTSCSDDDSSGEQGGLPPSYFSYSFDDGEQITIDENAVTNVEMSLVSGLSSLLYEVRDFSFTFSNSAQELDLMATLPIPQSGENWRLCIYDNTDNIWTDYQNATYASSFASVSLTIDLASELISASQTVRFAFFQSDNVLSDFSINMNPYGCNALSAEAVFSTESSRGGVMQLRGQNNNDIVHSFEANTEHTVSILGLYNNDTTTVDFDFEQSGAVDINYRRRAEISVAYSLLDDISLTIDYTSEFNNDPSAIYIYSKSYSPVDADPSSGINIISVGYDQYGKTRWMYGDLINLDDLSSRTIRPVEYNGQNCIVSFCAGDTGNKGYERLTYITLSDYAGKTIVSTPNIVNRPHHCSTMVTGSIIAFPAVKNNYKEGGYDDQGMIVEVDLSIGEVYDTYDLDDIIDDQRPTLISGNQSDDLIHINSLDYDKEDDCYVISARKQGVIKLKRGGDKSPSNLVWWMTPDNGIGDQWQDYLLTPVFENVFENWNLGQHSARILDNGDILMFDNHNPPTSNSDSNNRYSRVLIMRVNEADMSVENVYDFYSPDKEYCEYTSNADYYEHTNTIVSGWSTPKRLYETTFGDDKILLQGTTNFTFYRFYKIHLY